MNFYQPPGLAFSAHLKCHKMLIIWFPPNPCKWALVNCYDSYCLSIISRHSGMSPFLIKKPKYQITSTTLHTRVFISIGMCREFKIQKWGWNLKGTSASTRGRMLIFLNFSSRHSLPLLLLRVSWGCKKREEVGNLLLLGKQMAWAGS